MTKIKQIMTSRTSVNDICHYNESVYIHSMKNQCVGKSYTTPYFSPRPEALQKAYPWEYAINKYGFRGLDWTFEKSPAMFGCSQTFGIGVETTAAEVLADMLDIKNVPNLGLPGAGFVNIAKTFSAFTNHHPVSDAFFIIPPISRVFIPYENEEMGWMYQNYLPNYPRGNKKLFKHIISTFTDDVNISYTVDYIDWILQIAENKNIRVHWGSWDADTEMFLTSLGFDVIRFARKDNARDMMHFGVKSHKFLAEQMYNKIKDNAI